MGNNNQASAQPFRVLCHPDRSETERRDLRLYVLATDNWPLPLVQQTFLTSLLNWLGDLVVERQLAAGY